MNATCLPSRRGVWPNTSLRRRANGRRRFIAKRDLAAELLQAVNEMKAGQVQVVSSPVIEARKKTLGVLVRTPQGWEQGRRQPSGAARTLLAIANNDPKALLAVAGK